MNLYSYTDSQSVLRAPQRALTAHSDRPVAKPIRLLTLAQALGVGLQLYMPALAAQQLQLLDRQAVVYAHQIILVLLQGAAQPLALGRRLGRLG